MYPNGVPGPFLRGLYSGIGFKHLDPATDGAKIRKSFTQNLEQDQSWDMDATTDSFYIWNGILTAYTKCLLTKNQDKLVAISAIAKHFQPILKDEYKAGLWRRHLAQHLLWHVPSPRTVVLPAISSKNYCAPSWSWASLTANVTPYSGVVRHDKPVMIEILEVKVETQTADPMGQVSGGHIKVRGWLKHFRPSRRDDDDVDDDPTWQFKTCGQGICFAHPDQLPIPADPKWYCLPVLESAVRKWDGKKSNMVTGLILLEIGKGNKYRRVGRFDAQGKAYKIFKRPTYPFQATRNLEEEDMRSPSVPGGNGEDTISDSQQLERGTTAADMEINQNKPSSSMHKRRLVSSFFGREVAEEESQAVERNEPRDGQGEWWRFGWRKNQWVERVITIV
jgi:hypothetical protein